ncbi:MAG: GtrA family protein [Rhizobiaceae bacterium]|nr:GtrA family protein [Rhizobiaceae bacterium]
MAFTSITAETTRLARWPEWVRHLALASCIACVMFAIHAFSGFPQLTDARGDNDSLTRLVQVRDLLAGQAWFDLHQYRMGAGDGLLMHWSRLVDAPIAAIMLVSNAFGAGPELAETIARIVWPMLLFGLGLFAIIRIARMLGGEWAVFPAATLGAAALYFVNLFRPGSLDHHNLQIVLVLAVIALLADPARRIGYYAIAGIATALMLAIGLESLPYVAVAGAAVAVGFLFAGLPLSRQAAAFGLAFAGGTLAAFVATVGVSRWGTAYCDTLSVVHLAIASIAGFGLTAVALVPAANASFSRRMVALAALGAGLAATVVVAFPQCLADPYAAVDPELRALWIDRVSEVRSVIVLAAGDWPKLLVYYVTPLMALGFVTVRLAGPGRTARELTYAAFLAAACLVSVWQLRGSMFAIPLATVGLAAFIGRWRESLDRDYSLSSSIAMLAVWLLSFNIVWGFAGHAVGLHFKDDAGSARKASCYPDAGYGRLAALPKGTVLAVSDLGSPILFNTHHRVLAGPYHRNVDGNMLAMRAFTGSADAAEAIIRANGVDYVVFCAGNPENGVFAEHGPGGLMDGLVSSRAPDWLRPDAATSAGPIDIYRVVGREP